MSNPFYRGATGPSGPGKRNPFDKDDFDGAFELKRNISELFINSSLGGTASAEAFQQALSGAPVSADKFLPSMQVSAKSLAAAKLASKLMISGADTVSAPGGAQHLEQLQNSGVSLSAHDIVAPGAAPGADAMMVKIPGVPDMPVGSADLGDSLRGLLDLSVNTHPGNPASAMKAFLELVEKLFTVVPTDMINSMPDFDFYGQAVEIAEEMEKLKLLSS
jgi:hypothetical protein